jgi:hypothetical protein
MATRVYVVEDTEQPAALPRLVDATYEHTALRHVSQGRYRAHVATKRELVELGIGKGIKVEFADPLRGDTQVPLALESAAVELAPTN